MTKKSGEVNQPAIGFDTLAVPAQQRGHSKRVTKIMHPGRRYARWDTEIQLWYQGVERMANCPFVDAASFREGEQRHVRTLGTSMTFLDVAFEALRQSGPHRHESAFAELRIADEQRIAEEIGVAQFESGDFANAHAEPVKESEYHLINQASSWCPRFV